MTKCGAMQCSEGEDSCSKEAVQQYSHVSRGEQAVHHGCWREAAWYTPCTKSMNGTIKQWPSVAPPFQQDQHQDYHQDHHMQNHKENHHHHQSGMENHKENQKRCGLQKYCDKCEMWLNGIEQWENHKIGALRKYNVKKDAKGKRAQVAESEEEITTRKLQISTWYTAI